MSEGAARGSRTIAAAGLASLALAGNHLGPLAQPSALSAAAIGTAALLLGALAAHPPGLPRRARLASAILLVFAAVLLIPRAPSPEAAVAAVAALLLLGSRLFGGRTPLRALGLGGAVLAVHQLLWLRAGWYWASVDGATRAVTGVLGRTSGAGTELGPSVAGLPILVLLAAFVAARALEARAAARWRALSALGWLAAIAAGAGAFGVPLLLRAALGTARWLGAETGPALFPNYPASVAVFLPAALLAVALLPVSWLASAPFAAAPAAQARPRARAWSTAAAFAVSAGLATLAAWPVLLAAGSPSSMAA